MYCFVSIVLFYVLFVCKCVLLPTGVNPIAVKYIISYNIKAIWSFKHRPITQHHIPEDLNFHVYAVTSSKLRSYEFIICFLWQVIQTLINFGSAVIIQIHE